jgi:hypothetical protein
LVGLALVNIGFPDAAQRPKISHRQQTIFACVVSKYQAEAALVGMVNALLK